MNNLLPTALTVSSGFHLYRHYLILLVLLLRVIVLFYSLPWPPHPGRTIRFRITEFAKWSSIIQTPPNPRSSATVVVCPRPYPGLVVLETPFLLSQFFLTPRTFPPYRYVCIHCTRRNSIVLPSEALAPTLLPLPRVLSPPPIIRESYANCSGFPPDSKTIYLRLLIASPCRQVATFPLYRYEDRGVCSGSME